MEGRSGATLPRRSAWTDSLEAWGHGRGQCRGVVKAGRAHHTPAVMNTSDRAAPRVPFGDALPVPNRILVRGLNWLGDAVMSTPALQRLRQRFPQAQITLLTPAKLADLWTQHPSVDHILSVAPGSSPWTVARILRGPGSSGSAHSARGSAGYDLALVLPNSPRSALEVYLAQIPRRVGYARPWRSWLLTECVADYPGHVPMSKLSARQVRQLVRPLPGVAHPFPTATPAAHHIHQYLHLTAAVGANGTAMAPKLEVSNGEVAAARHLIAEQFGPPGQDAFYLGLSPSAAYGPTKRWAAENFATVAADVSRQLPGAVWVLLGTTADESLCARIGRLAGGKTVNLAGKTSLRQLMAVLKLCRVLLSNDSGPMHLAAALGTPVVAVFGSTSPDLTGPGLPGDPRQRLLRAEVPCAPCFRRHCPIDLRCLTGITPDRASRAVLETLEQCLPLSPV